MEELGTSTNSAGTLSLLPSNLRFDTFLIRGRQELRRSFWLHLMVRTGDFAKQSSGSAALETEGFARAGRACLRQKRDC